MLTMCFILPASASGMSFSGLGGLLMMATSTVPPIQEEGRYTPPEFPYLFTVLVTASGFMYILCIYIFIRLSMGAKVKKTWVFVFGQVGFPGLAGRPGF